MTDYIAAWLAFPLSLAVQICVAVVLGLILMRLTVAFGRMTPIYIGQALNAAREYERHHREGQRSR
jgi:hypothetical protein